MEVSIQQSTVLDDERVQHLKVVQDYNAEYENSFWEKSNNSNIPTEHISPRTNNTLTGESVDDPLSIIRLQLIRLFNEFGNGPHFDKFESLVVHQAFSYVESNQVHGAALLGISRNVMRTLLKRHGLLANRNNYKALDCRNDSENGNLDLKKL